MKFDKSKRIAKSNERKLFGVCGGIAEYFDIDPSIIRLLTLVVILVTGFFPGFVIYVVAAIILPNNTNVASNDDINNMKSANVDSEKSYSGSSSTGKAPHSDDEFNSYFDEKK